VKQESTTDQRITEDPVPSGSASIKMTFVPDLNRALRIARLVSQFFWCYFVSSNGCSMNGNSTLINSWNGPVNGIT
jgi:hypothetical protein